MPQVPAVHFTTELLNMFTCTCRQNIQFTIYSRQNNNVEHKSIIAITNEEGLSQNTANVFVLLYSCLVNPFELVIDCIIYHYATLFSNALHILDDGELCIFNQQQMINPAYFRWFLAAFHYFFIAYSGDFHSLLATDMRDLGSKQSTFGSPEENKCRAKLKQSENLSSCNDKMFLP